MIESNRNIIQLTLERSEEALEEARLLNAEEHPLGASNRIYYACFYVTTALLLTRDLSSSKHSGVMALFNKHFVKEGIISVDYGKFYARVFDQRQESDYAYVPEISSEQISEDLKTAEDFILEIKKIIRSMG
jgi:uncharacterized protein (UPF0332 family)